MTMSWLGTAVFWQTVAIVPAILALFTIAGRPFARCLPAELQAAARAYLAPALGLALYILLASYIARFLPVGDTPLVPLVIVAVTGLGLYLETDLRDLYRRLIFVGLFGLVCGTSILPGLYLFGAMDFHNDTFTYLAHSEWLQANAFQNNVSASAVTPVTTQIFLYQNAGLRMGASFLLAFLQAAINVQRADAIYPALMIAVIAVTSLSIGFPISYLLQRIALPLRTALLVLPSFGLNGLIFGATKGFLPQSVGLAVGTAALLLVGAVLASISFSAARMRILLPALPVALLCAAAIYSYSELAPFLAAAVGIAAVVRYRRAQDMIFLAAVAAAVVLVCNVELLRAYKGLLIQSKAVVGGPVDFSILQFALHAIGLKAGSWDIQPQESWILLPAAALLGLLAFSPAYRNVERYPVPARPLLPTYAMLALLIAAFAYFRFVVPSPFPEGVGQTWSQFKISEWAAPFIYAGAIEFIAAAALRKNVAIQRAVFVLAVCLAFLSILFAVTRLDALTRYYAGIGSIFGYYRDMRTRVIDQCEAGSPVAIEVARSDYEFRRILALYLADRRLRSDWSGDDYIQQYMPAARMAERPKRGDCLIESRNSSSTSQAAAGPVQIRVYDGIRQPQPVKVSGGYDLETDGSNTWRWVGKSITLTYPLDTEMGKAKVEFAYQSREAPIVVSIRSTGRTQTFVPAFVGAMSTFSANVDTAGKTLEVEISNAAEPQPLGANDARLANFILRNIAVTASSND